MQRWQEELLMARLMQRLLARNERLGAAGTTVDPGMALASPHRVPTLSRHGGPLWFAALQAWLKHR
jgi:hypothetical protein